MGEDMPSSRRCCPLAKFRLRDCFHVRTVRATPISTR